MFDNDSFFLVSLPSALLWALLWLAVGVCLGYCLHAVVRGDRNRSSRARLKTLCFLQKRGCHRCDFPAKNA